MALTPGLSVSLAQIQGLLFDAGRLRQALASLEEKARRLVARDRSDGLDMVGRVQMRDRLDGAMADELRRLGSEGSNRP
jgi:hypothetical protein